MTAITPDFLAASATFDLQTAANFVPPGQSLLRPEHTFLDAPAFNLKQLPDGSLFSEGCTGRGLEFRRVPSGLSREQSDTLHDLLLMSCGSDRDGWHAKQVEQLTAELSALGLSVPAVCFRAYGFGYPTSTGFAVVMNNTLFVL